MLRNCFLCKATPEPLRIAQWNLPLLPTQSVAYGVCPGCGMVMESESPTPEDMLRYYRDSAVYTNPGRAGKPTAGKIQGVNRCVQLVQQVVGEMPSGVFQVGSSDGYTLSRFQAAGAQRVSGVDPSPASCDLAKERYGVESQTGSIEECTVSERYPLWVMTHVLEHLYDPVATLRKARENQSTGDWLLVEVPLFERVDQLPPGYLTFEHLNYFSETTLLGCLVEAGYEEVTVIKSFEEDLYPIIRVLARALDAPAQRVFPNVFAGDRQRLRSYLEQEERDWSLAQARIHQALEPGRHAWIWGAGIHTSQLLAATDTARRLRLEGMIDSSPTRQGTTFGPYPIVSPEEARLDHGDAVIISSRASEQEIYHALTALRARGVDVVRLYAKEQAMGLSA